MPFKTTALVFPSVIVPAGETWTVTVPSPEGMFTPLRLLMLEDTARSLQIKFLKVSDREILKDHKVSALNSDLSLSLQNTPNHFSVAPGCVFELTVTNESKLNVPLLAGISGRETTSDSE